MRPAPSRPRSPFATLPILLLATAVLLAVAGTLSAIQPNARAQQAPDGSLAEFSLIQVIHGSPDAPAVDVYVNGELGFEGVAPFTASSIEPVIAQELRIQVTATGSPAGDAMIDTTFTLDRGAVYQIAAVGPVAEIESIVSELDVSSTEPDSARVRVFHGSADAGPVDVAVAGGDVLFTDAAYRDVTGYVDVPAGSYDLEIRAAGTDAVALSLPGTELEDGTAYTVFAVGNAADGSLTGVVASSVARLDCSAVLGIGEPTDVCVRAVHGSPDAGPVNVFIDGELAIEALEFGQGSEFAALPAGNYRIQVAPAEAGAGPGGIDQSALIDLTLPLQSGEAVDLAIFGPAAELELRQFTLELSDVRPGEARVQLFHGSADAGPVDVAIAGGDVLFPVATYLLAADSVAVEAGTYDLEVRPAGQPDVVLAVPGVELAAGQSYQLYAIGNVGDETLMVLPLSITATEGEAEDATPDASPVMTAPATPST